MGADKAEEIFAENRDEAENLLNEAMNAVETDGKLWFCYPKSGTDLNEKTVFDLLGDYDLSGVAKVPLNDKWIAIHISYSDDEDTNNYEPEKGGKFRDGYDE